MIHELYDSPRLRIAYLVLIELTYSGNLRVELASSVNCDVQLERSYLVCKLRACHLRIPDHRLD